MKTKDLVVISVDGCIRFGVVMAIIREERALAGSYDPIEGETTQVETMDAEGNKKIYNIHDEDEIAELSWSRGDRIGSFALKCDDFERAKKMKEELEPKTAPETLVIPTEGAARAET